MASDGIVYLLHFERCYRARCRHYVGWTQDLENRIRKHREGTAKSVTTKRAYDQGIGFVVARTLVGSPELERQIKARGPSNYCAADAHPRGHGRRAGRTRLTSHPLQPGKEPTPAQSEPVPPEQIGRRRHPPGTS